MQKITDKLGVNDLGGRLNEPFNPDEHDYEPWEKRVHAMRELLATKNLLSSDVLRRNIESLGQQEYRDLTYYEKWIHAISQAMLERGVVNDRELGLKIDEVKTRYEQQL